MTRALALLLGLLLLTLPAASQQVPNPMSNDAANAKLPEARQSLELGTVRSEGGDPPTNADAVTRFYSYGYPDGKKQFEIASQPFANEIALEQAGLSAPGGVGVGQGATRICWAPYSNNQVNCNFVAYGKNGQHRFANGAGFLGEFNYLGAGSTVAWLKFLGSDDDTSRVWAAGNHDDIDLELRAKGVGHANIYNDIGLLGRFESTGGVTPDAYFRFQGANSGINRMIASSDTLPNVQMEVTSKGSGEIHLKSGKGVLAKFVDNSAGATSKVWLRLRSGDGTTGAMVVDSDALTDAGMYLAAKGSSGITLANTDGNLATFNGAGTAGGVIAFTAAPPSGAGPARLGKILSGGIGMQLIGQNFVTSTKTANYTISVTESGARFDNIGATAPVVFTLPALAGIGGLDYGYNYCFSVDAAFSVAVKASGTDKIAFGATNSAAGGQFSSAAPFASMCVMAHKVGQWVTWATADKTQWTTP